MTKWWTDDPRSASDHVDGGYTKGSVVGHDQGRGGGLDLDRESRLHWDATNCNPVSTVGNMDGGTKVDLGC